MNKIKGIIFDVDGVIFDTERMSSDFWTKTMKKYGYEMGDAEYCQVMGCSARLSRGASVRTLDRNFTRR